MLTWCVVAAGVFLGSIIGGPQRGDLRVGAMHHEYVGVVACAAGAALHVRWLEKVGVVLTVDDAAQHLYQRINLHRLGPAALELRSPIWYGYQWTATKVVPLRVISDWLDRLLR